MFQERINFEYEKLFETGVDEMSWDDTVCGMLKMQKSETDTIKSHPAQRHQTKRNTNAKDGIKLAYGTAQTESQEDNFSADVHQAILNKANKTSKNSQKRGQRQWSMI